MGTLAPGARTSALLISLPLFGHDRETNEKEKAVDNYVLCNGPFLSLSSLLAPLKAFKYHVIANWIRCKRRHCPGCSQLDVLRRLPLRGLLTLLRRFSRHTSRQDRFISHPSDVCKPHFPSSLYPKLDPY